MDIFTINLDSRPDRWNRVMAIQRAYSWARFHRVPAVQIPMFPTAGCTVSHQLAILMACAEDMPSVTVAEDDLEPTRHFGEWPAVVEKARELGLDYVVGGVATSEDATPSSFVGSDERANPLHHAGGVMLVEACNGRGTHLITYFASAFHKILGLQFGLPIDAAIGLHPELRGGFAFPYVAVQGDGHSDLCGKAYDTPKLYEGSAVRWAERLRTPPTEPFRELLRPVVPASNGIETVRRLSALDLVAGRNRKPVAFDASLLLERKMTDGG